MFNVCPNCGEYSDEKTIDPRGPFAVCPSCGHGHPFRQLPLFVVTGASATGKSTVCLALPQAVAECVVLECDILWRSEFAHPENDYREFRDVWLRLAKNIGQAGRSVVLCGSAIPEQYESCPERRYLADIHYLAVVCEDEELVRRLKELAELRVYYIGLNNQKAPFDDVRVRRALNQAVDVDRLIGVLTSSTARRAFPMHRCNCTRSAASLLPSSLEISR